MARSVQTNKLVYKRCYVDWGGRCAYCSVGLPRFKRIDGKILASVDHFIPLAKGGLNSRGNRVLACYPCNLAKADIVAFSRPVGLSRFGAPAVRLLQQRATSRYLSGLQRFVQGVSGDAT